MGKTDSVQATFYEDLKNQGRSPTGKAKWRRYMKRTYRECVERLIGQSPAEAKPHDRLLLIERLSANLASIMLFYKADLSSESQVRAFELLKEAIEPVVRALEPSSAPVPTVVLTQLFEGVVTGMDRRAVSIEFKMDNDLEERKFSRQNLRTSRTIEEGQGVRARCQLELLPATEALAPEEIARWKEQYRGVEGYRKKAKPGRNLLEGDEA